MYDDIHPTTVGGIKRFAKQIKKEQNIPHHQALDIAAQAASFENFRHASNVLSMTGLTSSGHSLFFVAYWSDREKKQSGREVVEINLSVPLLTIASKHEFQRTHRLFMFRLASPDLFVKDDVSDNQESARNAICHAVRVLSFMEVTGLKSSKDGAYPNGDFDNRLPDTDHATDWYDPKNGQLILVDEPYSRAVVSRDREEWAAEHGWHVEASKWEGMYYPGMATMFVATDASTGYDIDGLMKKIDSLPYPLTSENWTGDSSHGLETFYSPLCISDNDKKRAVAKGTIYRFPSRKTLPMRSWDSSDNERRPNAVMSIESHKHAARLINAILYSGVIPDGVYMRISPVKSKLEDWCYLEHDSSTLNAHEPIYYGRRRSDGSEEPLAKNSEDVLSILQQLKGLLLDSYIDCAPLRKMVSKIDASINLTTKRL